MVQTNNYLDTSIRDIPTIIGENAKAAFGKVSDWTYAAKDWTMAHKKEILIALAVVCVAVALLGIGMIATSSGAIGSFTVDKTVRWGWNYYPSYGSWESTVSKMGFDINKSILQGSILALGGAFAANKSWDLSQQEKA